MKKITIILSAIILLIIFGGCEDNYKSIESNKFVPITVDADETSVFISSIKKYAETFEKNLILGSVQLIYNKNYDLEIDFTFTKKISSNKSSSLFLTYDLNKKGITYSEYIKGTSKVFSPFEKELNTSGWNINFNQGLSKLKIQMTNSNITTFKRIGCDCYDNEWLYTVFFSDQYEDRKEIIISSK